MRSKTLWLTDLGLIKVGSGELSPGLDPIELRFNPTYGHHLDEWEFEVGTLKGKHSVKLLDKNFNEEEKFFSFKTILCSQLADKHSQCADKRSQAPDTYPQLANKLYFMSSASFLANASR